MQRRGTATRCASWWLTGRFAPHSEAARRRLAGAHEVLAILDGHLRERPFLAADRYTIADAAVFAYSSGLPAPHPAHSFRVICAHSQTLHAWPMAASRYELRIKGRLGEALLGTFAGFDAEVEPVETVLRGDIEDQAALHGVLERIHEAGLEIVEVRKLEPRRS